MLHDLAHLLERHPGSGVAKLGQLGLHALLELGRERAGVDERGHLARPSSPRPSSGPSTSKICSAASIWRRSAAARRPSSTGPGSRPWWRRTARSARPPAGRPSRRAAPGRWGGPWPSAHCTRQLRLGSRLRCSLVSYDAGAGVRAGLLRDGRVHDIQGEAHTRRRTAPGRAPRRRPTVRPAERRALPLTDLRLLPPVGRPGKIICIGLNYRSHARSRASSRPRRPRSSPSSRTRWPPGADGGAARLQQQGGLRGRGGVRDRQAAARTCRRSGALDHVAGYMLLNDLSARDYQFKTPQWMPGKTFDGAAPHAARRW